jgi:hypothetical protein
MIILLYLPELSSLNAIVVVVLLWSSSGDEAIRGCRTSQGRIISPSLDGGYDAENGSLPDQALQVGIAAADIVALLNARPLAMTYYHEEMELATTIEPFHGDKFRIHGGLKPPVHAREPEPQRDRAMFILFSVR